MTDARAAFEAWFASVYGPPPSDAQILVNLAESARLEAFMGGAWAAWQHWADRDARRTYTDADIAALKPADPRD